MAKFLGPYLFDGANDTNDLPAFEGPVTYLIQAIGTSTQTIEFQDTMDGGTTYHAVNLVLVSTEANVASITAPGMWKVGGAAGSPFTKPRLRNTAFTSGSFNLQVMVVPRP